MSHWLENPMAEQQSGLREELPVLWESYRSGHAELVEASLRRLFAFVQSIHAANRKNAEAAYHEARQRWMRWQKLAAGLRTTLPDYCAEVKALLPDLETRLVSVTDTEIRSSLSFCLGGLRRVALLNPAKDLMVEPQEFPQGLEWDEVGPESILKAAAGFRNPTAITSPAQLLGRLESIAMNWWYSHLQLSELYAKAVSETQAQAVRVQKAFLSQVEDYLIPVVDTLYATLNRCPESEFSAGWREPLRKLQPRTRSWLSQAGIEILPAHVGEPFDPATQKAMRPASFSPSAMPGSWLVTKVLRWGYRTECETLRLTEVEVAVADAVKKIPG